MSYTNNFKQEALELVKTIGITKASEQLHVNKVTLRNWRKKAEKQPSIAEEPCTPNTAEESPTDQAHNLIKKLQEEIQEQQKINQACQETINHLANENAALRRQCENYLKAISLISSIRPTFPELLSSH